MDDLDQVLAAIRKMEQAEGAQAVADLLGADLSRLSGKTAKIAQGAGLVTSREIILKIGRLCWQKADHKKRIERG